MGLFTNKDQLLQFVTLSLPVGYPAADQALIENALWNDYSASAELASAFDAMTSVINPVTQQPTKLLVTYSPGAASSPIQFPPNSPQARQCTQIILAH